MIRKPLVVDCRMLFQSGIGTYLRALLPRIAARAVELEIVVLARRADFDRITALAPVRLVACEVGVYSPFEQLALLRATPRRAAVYWAPHINFPIAHRGRLVVTVHDLFPFALGRALGTRLDKLVHTRTLLRALRYRAHHVVTVSEFTKRELVRWLGPMKQPISVVPNGLEPSWFSREPGARLCSEPYVVCVGNVKPHKNIGRLIEAFAQVASRAPHKLVLVGERDGFADPREKGLAKLARSVQGRIVFTGKVGDAELVSYVAHADALVLASLYEGFGLPPLEAMARRVPVLVSRAGALPEVCGDAALYCDPLSVDDIADKLGRLLADEDLRQRLREAGVARAQSFDWDRSAERMVAILGSP